MNITIYDRNHPLTDKLRKTVADFLFLHLGRYGDPLEDIRMAIEYTQKTSKYAGGFICLATEDGVTVGAAVINHTGMKRYIPENILVYIAVHSQFRGQGIGRRLMHEIIGRVKGGIALHVEPDNPARILYQSLGFTNKYLEMRLDGKEVV